MNPTEREVDTAAEGTAAASAVKSAERTSLDRLIPSPDLHKLMRAAGYNIELTHPAAYSGFSYLKFVELLVEYLRSATRTRPADAWLIERSDGSKEVVLSPLTDATFMDEGDEAWALYRDIPSDRNTDPK